MSGIGAILVARACVGVHAVASEFEKQATMRENTKSESIITRSGWGRFFFFKGSQIRQNLLFSISLSANSPEIRKVLYFSTFYLGSSLPLKTSHAVSACSQTSWSKNILLMKKNPKQAERGKH